MVEFCQCGCGNPAPIAVQTSKREGCIKGLPKRFIKGHYARIHPPTFNYGLSQNTKSKRWAVHCRDGSKNYWSHIVYQNYLGGKELPPGFVIHHKNENTNDDKLNNLELMRPEKHMALHKNRKKSVILAKDRIIMKFESARAASLFLKVSKGTVATLIGKKCRVKGWLPYYLD